MSVKTIIDCKDVAKIAKVLENEMNKNVKQVKFAAMKSLNSVAFKARTGLIDDFSKSFTVRNKSLPKAVAIQKAEKEKLVTTVSFPKDWMYLNTVGGEKRPDGSKALAFPGSEIDNGARLSSGKIKQSQKPKQLLKYADSHPGRTKGGKGAAKPHAFKTVGKHGYQVVGIREGTGDRDVKWLYSLQDKAKIEKKWDFFGLVKETAEKELPKEFEKQLKHALETAK